ncbi:MAG: GNAT family N-acetyltransferase [Bacteroidales bacterium]
MKSIGKGEVLLRNYFESDLPLMVEYANNKKVSINLRDAFPSPYTIENAQALLQMANHQNPRTFFAIEYKGAYVGNICLSLGEDVYRRSAEIGYLIGEPHWNRGIATQAVNLITQYGFQELDLLRIYTGIFEYNRGSQRVLEKCGFKQEAIFEQAICKNNMIYSEIRYCKLRYV